VDNKEKNKESSRNFTARLFVKGKCYAFNEQIISQPSLNDNRGKNTRTNLKLMKKWVILGLKITFFLLPIVMFFLVMSFKI
jgi:hypothetical protein